MSKTERFKKWLISKALRKAPAEPLTSPVVSPKPIEALETRPSTRASVSFYEITETVTHVVFNENSKAFQLIGKKDRTDRLREKEKEFLKVVDPVTKRFKKVPKKNIGDISNVNYYGDGGRLID